MNLQYLKIGIPLALIGGLLGIIASIWMLITPVNILAMFSINVTFVMLAYLSLIASIIIVILALLLIARKLLAKLKTVLYLVVILGIIELMNFNMPFMLIAVIGGLLAILGGILALIGLRPGPAPAAPAKPAKASKAK